MSDNNNPNPQPQKGENMTDNLNEIWRVTLVGYINSPEGGIHETFYKGSYKDATNYASELAHEITHFDAINTWYPRVEKATTSVLEGLTMANIQQLAFMLKSDEPVRRFFVEYLDYRTICVYFMEIDLDRWYDTPLWKIREDVQKHGTVVIRNPSERDIRIIEYLNAVADNWEGYENFLERNFTIDEDNDEDGLLRCFMKRVDVHYMNERIVSEYTNVIPF